ncbi:MAG: hypothetical protein CMJ40_07145 [Phycisphaerae bacterium]|nr:hypothetical protein [Phycisphaerae bacterium]
MRPSTGIGSVGERIAARWLRRRGWRIIDVNRRVGCDEIDVIAESPDGISVSFIEVKSSRQIDARLIDRVDEGKRARLRRSARRLASRFPRHRVRVDVMTVELSRWPWSRVHHYGNVVQYRGDQASGRSRGGTSFGGGSPFM